jgi:hypothetical protein
VGLEEAAFRKGLAEGGRNHLRHVEITVGFAADEFDVEAGAPWVVDEAADDAGRHAARTRAPGCGFTGTLAAKDRSTFMPKLKVYRTPIGFHDAYVAATSQKAALKAWGADADLFARGAADVVTDPGLSEAPLAHPGDVIRLPRGTEAQHIKALGRRPVTARARKADPEPETDAAPTPRAEKREPIPAPPVRKAQKPKPSRPRPSRAALDKAETALRDAEARHDAEQTALAERKRALEQEQRDLRARQAAEKEQLEAALKTAGAQFRARLEAWAAETE